MNVIQTSNGRRSSAAATPSKVHNAEGRLNFYTEPPSVELSIDDFEVFAIKRLKVHLFHFHSIQFVFCPITDVTNKAKSFSNHAQVLKKIERLKMMRKPQDDYRKELNELIDEEGLHDDQLDECSHFILRLCYCQSEELRRWFLHHEAFLFQHRLKSLESKQMARAVRAYCQVKPISDDEKEQHREALMQFMVNPVEFERSKFYAVPFTQVLDLVAQRQCYLWRGQAYIPHARVESLLVSKFRADLSRTLASMGAHHVLSTETAANDPEAGRLVPLVANLNRCLVTEEPGAGDVALAGTALTAGNVTQHVPYMPLCMRQLQSGLQKDKKLKHWGRLQYGLFLKVGTTSSMVNQHKLGSIVVLLRRLRVIVSHFWFALGLL